MLYTCRYMALHTWALIFVMWVVFFYMAAEYPYWLQHADNSIQKLLVDLPNAAPPSGPNSMLLWITQSSQAWRAFSPFFLVCAIRRPGQMLLRLHNRQAHNPPANLT